MALNPKLSVASRNLALNAALDVLNSGFIDIYDGTQPADADTAITTQVKLAHCALSATAFAAASAGSKVANAIGNGTGLATSTATWYRLYKSDGVTAVADGSVGTATSNLVMNSVAIQTNATVTVSSMTFTMAA
jgi:hypothetical protein